MAWLSDGEKSLTVRLAVLTQYGCMCVADRHLASRGKNTTLILTFTGGEFQCDPESVIAACCAEGEHTSIEPVAGRTLERGTAVVRR